MMTLISRISKKPVQLMAGGLLAVGAAVLPGAAMLAPIGAAQAQTQADDLDRAIAALRGISTLRADFVQTDRQGQSVRGVLSLKRPGKIRFDYGKDAELLVVSNGKSLYMVDYEVSQVERWPIKNSPLGALLDPKRDVKRYGTLLPTDSRDVISVLVEDPNKPEYGAINLIFLREASAPGGFQLMYWVAKDAQNHRTTVQLTNHRYGVAIAESTFSFDDPRRSSRRPK
jgi:outer membrane lipoprotein-sorting protein